MLAHLLRAGLTPEVYALSKEVRTKKRVLRQRVFLVGIRTMVKNRVRVLLSQHGVKPPTFFGKKSLLWLKEEPELPEPDGWLLREEVELAETLKKIRAAEGLIKELAEGGGGGGVAQEPAGRGEFFSVLIRREVGEMERFPSPKKFASYTGLVPSTYASGKRVTKEGNKWLRWASHRGGEPRGSAARLTCTATTCGSKPDAVPRMRGPRPPGSWPSWPGRCVRRNAPTMKNNETLEGATDMSG